MDPFPPWSLVYGLAIGRTVLVVAFFFGLLPALLIPDFPDAGSAGVVGRFVIAMFITIVGAHLLAPLHLYEGITIIALIVVSLLWRYYLRYPEAERSAMGRRIAVDLLDLIDRATGRGSRKSRVPAGRVSAWSPVVPRNAGTWTQWAVLLGVVAVSAWMRYATAFQHAAFAYDDAPVTLVWMKEFDAGILYSNGVYAKGFYAFFTILKKLSAVNPALVMEAAGPLVGVLTVLSVAGLVRWATGSTLAASAAAMVMGTLPGFMPMAFARQAGYNSQEFGDIFALPAAWFTFRFLMDGKRWYLIAAAAAAGVVMTTHLVSSVVMAAFMGGAFLAALLSRSVSGERLVQIVIGMGVAAVVAILPLAIGHFGFGIEFHSASADFLTGAEKGLFEWPPVKGALVLLIPAVLAPLGTREGRWGLWCAVAMMLAGMALWVLPFILPFGGFVAMLSNRIGIAAGFSLSIAAGLTWFGVERLLQRFRPGPIVLSILFALVAAITWVKFPLQPAAPPHFSSDEVIMQALRVDDNLRQGEWVTIMEDGVGFSLAYRRGQTQLASDFLKHAVVGPAGWCWKNAAGKLVPQPLNVAIFVDSRYPETRAALQRWIDERVDKLPLRRVYQGQTLDVWLLQYRPDPADEKDKVWGNYTPKCNVTTDSQPSGSN